MKPDFRLWDPNSFNKRPERRWLRAEYIRATRCGRDSQIDDGWVDAAGLVLRGSGDSGTPAAAVQAAHQVWTGDPVVRGELEALLLTDLPFDTIAKRCKLTLSTVEAYEAVFFAVRAMRGATDWLSARVIEYTPWAGFTGPMPAAAWKLAALEGGPIFLDWVIASTLGRELPEGMLRETGRRRELEDVHFRLSARLWMALRAAVTDEAFARVLRAYQQLRDLNAQLGRDVAIPASQAAVEAFLWALPSTYKKAKGRRRRDKEMVCHSSPSISSMRNTNLADAPVLLDVQQVVDDIAHAIDAVQKTENSVRTPSARKPVAEPKHRRRAG